MSQSARVVVCGAGIAGISTAFHLTRLGITDVVIVDSRPPLTLTSDKSTECYRNWWPTQHMVSLMSALQSISSSPYADESRNRFSLSRRGYLYVDWRRVRNRRGWHQTPITTLLLVRDPYERTKTYLKAMNQLLSMGMRRGLPVSTCSPRVTHSGTSSGLSRDGAVGGIHVRRAGWLSAHQLGAWMPGGGGRCWSGIRHGGDHRCARGQERNLLRGR